MSSFQYPIFHSLGMAFHWALQVMHKPALGYCLQSHWKPSYLLNEYNNLLHPIKIWTGQRFGWQRASEILGLYAIFIDRAQTVEKSSGYRLKEMYSHLYRKHMAEFNLGVNKNTLSFTPHFSLFLFHTFPNSCKLSSKPITDEVISEDKLCIF